METTSTESATAVCGSAADVSVLEKPLVQAGDGGKRQAGLQPISCSAHCQPATGPGNQLATSDDQGNKASRRLTSDVPPALDEGGSSGGSLAEPAGNDNALQPSTEQNQAAMWYFRAEEKSFPQMTEDQPIAGPCTTDRMCAYHRFGYVDGLTFVWRKGMAEWKPIAECEDLKKLLVVSEDVSETEGIAAAASTAQKSVSSTSDSPKKETKRRKAISEIDPHFVYTSPEGVVHAFDETDSSWRTLEEYEKLVEDEAGSPPPLPQSEGSKDELSPQAETHDVPEETDSGNDSRDPESMLRKIEKAERRRQYRQRLKQRKDAGLLWQPAKVTTNVYVSGLPDDVTEEELANVFKRGGVIKIDPKTMERKIRIYKDDSGCPKGDALVCYANAESVDLAIKYFNEYEFRDNRVITVQPARFDPPPSTGKAERLTHPVSDTLVARDRSRYLAAKYEQQRLMQWGEDIDDGSGRRIVIFKPMFSRAEAQKHEADDPFYEILKKEVEDELSRYAEVEKVTPIPRHPQGVVCVKFRTSEAAEAAITDYRGRYFAGHPLEVYFFDKKTDLKAQCLPSNHGPSGDDFQKPKPKLVPHKMKPALDGEPQTPESRPVDPRNASRLADESWAADRDDDFSGGARDRPWTDEGDEPEAKKVKIGTQTAARAADVDEEAETQENAQAENGADPSIGDGEDEVEQQRLDEYGRELDEQSSDEEFAIQTE